MPFGVYTLPAPGGGLNLIDGNVVGIVPENDALELVNLFPKNQTTVEIRGGITDHCDTSESAEVVTLESLNKTDGTTKLIAAVNNTFQDVTTSTSSDITGSTTPTDDNWNTCTFAHRLWLANGVDTPQVYTGSGTMSDQSWTGGGTPTLTNIINVGSYKQRFYAITKNDASIYYSGSKSVTGALTEFEIDYYLSKGGYILFADSWTNQTASTSSDLFMVCSSEGEVLFYSGSYPGDSSWTLVARYYIGKPMGYRAFVRVNNDVWIITEQGIVPVSLLFQQGEQSALNAIGRKTNKLIRQFAKSQGVSHRWKGVFWPQGKRVYIQIPTAASNTKHLVLNSETFAWCLYEYATSGRVTDLSLADGLMYCGDDSGVIRTFESGTSDDNESINFKWVAPYNYMGDRASFKRFVDVRPLIYTGNNVTLTLGIDTDFRDQRITSTITTTTGTTTPWGSAWGSAWSSGADFQYNRYSLEGQGHTGAIRIEGSLKGVPLEFRALEIRFETGAQT